MARFSTPDQIRVGVVGYGGAFNMGRAHLREMQKAGMTPCAVAEPDEARRKVATDEFPGIATHASVTEMLAAGGVDLVTLITPHNTHAPLGLECLNAGVGVVCEKPFAITTAECDAMIAVAREKGVVLSTYHNRHWDGCVLKALEVVRSGRIGEVVRVNLAMGGYSKPLDWWRSSKSVSGGILYDWGVHLLEYTLQILGRDATEVSGHLHSGFWAQSNRWKEDTIEDDGFAVIRFEGGTFATLQISHLETAAPEYWVRITGTLGSHEFRADRYRTTTHVERDDRMQAVVEEGPNPDSEGWRFYQNIADHMVRDEPLVITPEWARRPIHFIELAERSSVDGRALPVTYP